MTNHNHNHPFHLVIPNPWPLIISFSIFNNLFCTVRWFHNFYTPILSLSIPDTLICIYLWWRDVLREATYQGCHSIDVYKNRNNFIYYFRNFLFYFFFLSILSLAPRIEIGQSWPSKGIIPFNSFDIPLLNTIILVSGLTVTWSYHALINKNINETKKSLLITIILEIYFSLLQLMKYINVSFTIADSIYQLFLLLLVFM